MIRVLAGPAPRHPANQTKSYLICHDRKILKTRQTSFFAWDAWDGCNFEAKYLTCFHLRKLIGKMKFAKHH